MGNNDGGPAFPCPTKYNAYTNESNVVGDPGMSLRDWFAGQALTGILAKKSMRTASAAVIAGAAYELANAMIAESNEWKEMENNG